MLWILVLLLGCGGEEPDVDTTQVFGPPFSDDTGDGGGGGDGGGDSGGDSGDDTGPFDCDDMPVDACGETDSCSQILGRPMDANEEGEPCVDWATEPVPLGCMDAGMGWPPRNLRQRQFPSRS